MTTKNHEKEFKQLNSKPVKKAKFVKHNKPKLRTCGRGLKSCRRCGRHGGHIGKYGLDLCRQCFREMAKGLGFRKYN